LGCALLRLSLHHLFISLCVLALVACGSAGPVRRVFAPSASIQQLTVSNDGHWQVQLRLRNYSTVAMHFERLELVLALDEQTTIPLNTAPQLVVSPDSADIWAVDLQPESAARLVLADTLAAGRTLPYTLHGRINATPQGGKSRRFTFENRSQLNAVPGLPGVLR